MSRVGTLLGLALCALVSGCTYGEHHTTDNTQTAQCATATTRQGTIDTDGLIDVEGGDGVGVFVEYSAGGRYHVFTTCDTKVSGHDCLFDVVLHPVGGNILAVSAEDLETDDSVTLYGPDGIQFVTYTDYDYDGFYVDVDPGTGLSVDALLDDGCASSYVYWVGDGAVHSGAPSTPFELLPSAL